VQPNKRMSIFINFISEGLFRIPNVLYMCTPSLNVFSYEIVKFGRVEVVNTGFVSSSMLTWLKYMFCMVEHKMLYINTRFDHLFFLFFFIFFFV
jgi:hypothetical protein